MKKKNLGYAGGGNRRRRAAATAAGGRRRVAVSKPKFDIIKLTPNVDVCKKPHLNIFKNTPLNPPPYIKYCKWDIPFEFFPL